MNDNSFLIGDKVAVSKKYSAINHTEVRQGTIVRQSENSETGEPVYFIKDSEFIGSYFWADNDDITLQ